jgi:hypothetical protein
VTNPFPSIRLRAETKAALEAEAERRRKKDGGRWSMDQIIASLLNESGKSVVPALRPRRKKGGR